MVIGPWLCVIPSAVCHSDSVVNAFMKRSHAAVHVPTQSPKNYIHSSFNISQIKQLILSLGYPSLQVFRLKDKVILLYVTKSCADKERP